MSPILEIKGVTKRYGGLTANNKISFDVNEGEILSVIGPNGAGKSTLFKLIASFVRTTSGEVLFRGQKISDLAPHKVARMGVVRTFQETTIFKSMTVRENIVVAHHLRSKASLFGFFIGSKQARIDEAGFGKSADDIIDFLGLQAIRNELASNLPQGHLRALGMAIGLATKPTVLLLDEPFAGMNHDETMKMVTQVRRLRDERGVTVLLVEHDMPAVMKISDRIVVINFGEKIAEGTPAEIQADPKANNLRGKPVRYLDGSGQMTSVAFDFKGNLLEVQKQMPQDAQVATVDWNHALLEPTIYTQITEYDALNRMSRLYNWFHDRQNVSVYLPVYSPRGVLQSEDLVVKAQKTDNGFTGGTRQTVVRDINYDAKANL